MRKIISIISFLCLGLIYGELIVTYIYSADTGLLQDVLKSEENFWKKSERHQDKEKIHIGKMIMEAYREVVATAYSNDPVSINVSKWRDGKTATMTEARWGVVAVDPRVIPLGSKIFIEGMGWFSAEDTGGKIKGNRIDIFYPSRKEALQFGKRKLKILVVDNG